MPLFNFVCEKCGKEEDHVVFQSDKEDVVCECGNVMMKAFPDTMNFELKYNNKRDICSWAYDGYASSQYYKETNKLAKHNIYDMGEKK